jgi:hypothetical protein
MSKTRLFQSIKSLDVDAVSALLGSHPELARVKDERRRNALHVLCGLPYRDDTSHRSLALARLLLDRGFDVNEPAFVEGEAPSRPRRSGTRSPAVATCPSRDCSCDEAPRRSIASGRRGFTTTWRPSISS